MFMYASTLFRGYEHEQSKAAMHALGRPERRTAKLQNLANGEIGLVLRDQHNKMGCVRYIPTVAPRT